jgi:hypothetical protein
LLSSLSDEEEDDLSHNAKGKQSYDESLPPAQLLCHSKAQVMRIRQQLLKCLGRMDDGLTEIAPDLVHSSLANRKG